MKKSLLNTISKELGVKVSLKEDKTKRSFKTTSSIKSSIKMDKETFCKIIVLLEDIEEASSEMLDMGVDLGPHEGRFYEIIEMLLNTILTSDQISLIHIYLFGDSYIEDIPTVLDKKGNITSPETPEELWDAINSL